MKLDIVTPEGVLFTGEVEAVVVPGVLGEFEILDNHAPIVSILDKGKVRIKGKNLDIEEDVIDQFIPGEYEMILPINSGTVEAKNNQVTVLAE